MMPPEWLDRKSIRKDINTVILYNDSYREPDDFDNYSGNIPK